MEKNLYNENNKIRYFLLLVIFASWGTNASGEVPWKVRHITKDTTICGDYNGNYTIEAG